MPVYYFDIIDNGVLSRDEFGMELGDFHEARDQAQSLLPDIARDELPDGEAHDFVCEVRTDRDRIVYRAMLVLRAAVVDEPCPERDADRKGEFVL